MSRPQKFTPELVATIVSTIREGNGRVNACRVAGIHYQTFLDWIDHHVEFSEAVKKAEAEAEADRKEAAIAAIRKAYESNGQWQAAAWWLERKHPDEYAKREPNSQPDTNIRIEVNYKDGSDNPD